MLDFLININTYITNNHNMEVSHGLVTELDDALTQFLIV